MKHDMIKKYTIKTFPLEPRRESCAFTSSKRTDDGDGSSNKKVSKDAMYDSIFPFHGQVHPRSIGGRERPH